MHQDALENAKALQSAKADPVMTAQDSLRLFEEQRRQFLQVFQRDLPIDELVDRVIY